MQTAITEVAEAVEVMAEGAAEVAAEVAEVAAEAAEVVAEAAEVAAEVAEVVKAPINKQELPEKFKTMVVKFLDFVKEIKPGDVDAAVKMMIQKEVVEMTANCLRIVLTSFKKDSEAIFGSVVVKVKTFLVAYLVLSNPIRVLDEKYMGPTNHLIVKDCEEMTAKFKGICERLVNEGLYFRMKGAFCDLYQTMKRYVIRMDAWKKKSDDMVMIRIRADVVGLREAQKVARKWHHNKNEVVEDDIVKRLTDRAELAACMFGDKEGLEMFSKWILEVDSRVEMEAAGNSDDYEDDYNVSSFDDDDQLYYDGYQKGLKTNLTREQLAHNIIINPLFQYPPEKREPKYYYYMRTAWWVIMEEELKIDPPEYTSAVKSLNAIRMIMNHRAKDCGIDLVIDSEHLKSQGVLGLLEVDAFVNVMQRTAQIVSKYCPRKDEWEVIRKGLDSERKKEWLYTSMRFLFDCAYVIETQTVNSVIRSMALGLRDRGVEYERMHYEKMHGGALERTKAWLAPFRCGSAVELMQAHYNAVFSLVTSNVRLTRSTVPEILSYDVGNLNRIGRELTRIASCLARFCWLNTSPLEDQQMALREPSTQKLLGLLTTPISREIQTHIEDVAKNPDTNQVFGVMKKRLSAAMLECAMHHGCRDVPKFSPPESAAFYVRICNIATLFRRVCELNRAAFHDIITASLLPKL